jgi:hypothetical protein
MRDGSSQRVGAKRGPMTGSAKPIVDPRRLHDGFRKGSTHLTGYPAAPLRGPDRQAILTAHAVRRTATSILFIAGSNGRR